MNDILERFKKHARDASYHYADDSTKEWGLGDREKRQALELFDANPDLQPAMRDAAARELWSLNRERPLED